MGAAGLVVAGVNAVWQSGLLVLLALVALAFARANATTKAAVWTAVLLASALLVPVDLAFEPSAAASAHQRASATGPASLAKPVWSALRSARERELTLAQSLSVAAGKLALPLLALWLVLAGRRLWLLSRSARDVRALKRRALTLGDHPLRARLEATSAAVRGARIGLCDGLEVPCAIGFLRPMVLLPRALFERLDAEDIYATVAHELGHLRRRDDVVVLLQAVVESLLFFNPFLVLIGRRIDFYREAACDDLVISNRASALRYAQCLATILERATRGQRAAAPALLHGRAQVSARVERLVNWKEGPHTMGRAALLIGLAVAVSAVFFVRVQLPLLGSFAEARAPQDTTIIISRHHNGGDETLLGALDDAGYAVSTDDAIALSDAGVDSDFVVSVSQSGMERPTVSGLIELAQAGVDGDVIAAAVRSFGSSVPVSDVVRLHENGLDADELNDLRPVLCPQTTVSEIIALHDAGVDADYIRHVNRHERLSVRNIIRLHNAGVDS
jgi:beta-lactamase regulating signal transducer with metallopeptidase domain